MTIRLDFDLQPQPDDSTCGPTCLQGVYRFFGDELPLEQVVAEVPQLDTGGTLAVMLGLHALRRGYSATIHTFNLILFDPTWFDEGAGDLAERLRAQARVKTSKKLRDATRSYLEFLELGGRIVLGDVTPQMLIDLLERDIPILTGLSATYLYRCARETDDPMAYDDVRGSPQGHFVVLCGYDPRRGAVRVADPLQPNPLTREGRYEVEVHRLITSIMLGILTYDANLLVVQPRGDDASREEPDGNPDRRRES